MEEPVVVSWGPDKFFVFIISTSGDLMYNIYTISSDNAGGGSWKLGLKALEGLGLINRLRCHGTLTSLLSRL
jgi:hypothetical protein